MPLPSGVYAAAVTPRRPGTGDINLGVMWDLFDFLCERKIDGIVLLGSTGEFIHYCDAERTRLIELAVRRSRVPVIVNISHSTLDGAVELAQAAADSGAAGLLLMPPFYFHYDEDLIRTFILRFAEQSDIEVPVLLYNLPQFGNPISSPLAAELISQDVVQGITDSSGDREYFSTLIARRQTEEFILMAGSDILFAQVRPHKIHGVISDAACAVPELLVALEGAWRTEARELFARLETRLAEFLARIDGFAVPVGIREALWLRQIKVGPNAIPFSPEGERLIGEFRAWFPGWLKIVLSECRNA
jgi:dihydrodipicolinate synthase/N-acetylneuraminate lyase